MASYFSVSQDKNGFTETKYYNNLGEFVGLVAAEGGGFDGSSYIYNKSYEIVGAIHRQQGDVRFFNSDGEEILNDISIPPEVLKFQGNAEPVVGHDYGLLNEFVAASLDGLSEHFGEKAQSSNDESVRAFNSSAKDIVSAIGNIDSGFAAIRAASIGDTQGAITEATAAAATLATAKVSFDLGKGAAGLFFGASAASGIGLVAAAGASFVVDGVINDSLFPEYSGYTYFPGGEYYDGTTTRYAEPGWYGVTPATVGAFSFSDRASKSAEHELTYRRALVEKIRDQYGDDAAAELAKRSLDNVSPNNIWIYIL